jgi:hypothetical protein
VGIRRARRGIEADLAHVVVSVGLRDPQDLPRGGGVDRVGVGGVDLPLVEHRVVARRCPGRYGVVGCARRHRLRAGGVEAPEAGRPEIEVVRMERERGQALLPLVGDQIRRRGQIEEGRETPVGVDLVDKAVLVGDEAATAAVPGEQHGSGSRPRHRARVGQLGHELHVDREPARGDGSGHRVGYLGEGGKGRELGQGGSERERARGGADHGGSISHERWPEGGNARPPPPGRTRATSVRARSDG